MYCLGSLPCAPFCQSAGCQPRLHAAAATTRCSDGVGWRRGEASCIMFFTLEYCLRLLTAPGAGTRYSRTARFAAQGMNLIDLLSIAPWHATFALRAFSN